MQFWSDIRGNFAMIFALVLPVLLICMGMAVDYGVWIHQKQEMQRIADEAALAAAGELYMANTTSSQAESTAEATATKQMAAAGMAPSTAFMTSSSDATASRSTTSVSADGGAATADGGGGAGGSGSGQQTTTFGGEIGIKTQVNAADGSVEVVINQPGATYFSQMFMSPPVISVISVARAVGGGRICVLALEATEDGGVSVQQRSTLRAERCGVFSNSTSANGVAKGSAATIEAELICSAGGYDGNSSYVSPDPVTDCPQIEDPLANREPPEVGACDYEDVAYQTTREMSVTLMPGVYCGGLTLRGPVKVWLEPGIYVMKDGPLITSFWAELRGENVGVYFTGDKATFRFAIEGVVNLTAPKEGPMAGILFFEDRESTPLRPFMIASDDARVLLGTIYLPNGRFIVATAKPIADQSAYTAIIARRVELNVNPTLVLNADYGSTDIPVPAGINYVGRNIVLAR